jgi:SAM-dependent methyltransferase
VIMPRAVVSECYRVLRPGGQLAMVFPPFYHPRAGSHLEGYATRLPGMHLLFPTSTIKAAAKTILEEQGIEYESYLRQIETDKLWNLNGLTVRGFKRLVRESGFSTEVVRYIGDLDHRVRDHAHRLMALRRVPVSWLTEAPAQVPLLQEVCCYRICAILQKPR